jgi:hypothetical protein
MIAGPVFATNRIRFSPTEFDSEINVPAASVGLLNQQAIVSGKSATGVPAFTKYCDEAEASDSAIVMSPE